MKEQILPRGVAAGLTDEQVLASRRLHGANTLTKRKRKGFFRQYLSSFGDPIIKILLVALAINVIFLFRNSDWMESAGIAVAVFLATFVSTLSQYGSESAFIELQRASANIECRVRRAGGVRSLPVGELVVGDIVLLEAGEKIPADGVLLSGKLSVDQSALNGESAEAEKLPLSAGGDWDLMHKNQLFRGSIVSAGEGVMRVERVGDKTFYGGLAREMQDEPPESPLRVKLAGLAKTLSRLGYIAAVLIAVADLFNSFFIDNGMNFSLAFADMRNWKVCVPRLMHALTLAIAIVVVAVPEGLPMMIAVVLSSNMLRMLKDKVMVRKPVGIEASGGVNILFTDKTGTLTKGELEAVKYIDGSGQVSDGVDSCGKIVAELLRLNGVFNSGSVVSANKALGGNATDRALLKGVLPLSFRAENYLKVSAFPFDSAHKFSAACVRAENGGSMPIFGAKCTFVKGAPEKILPFCQNYVSPNGMLCPFDAEEMGRKQRAMTCRAMRVLAVAVARSDVTGEKDLHGLTFVALVGIRDDIRAEVPAAIEEVRRAGIQVVMITGDNIETAKAVAEEAGLLQPLRDLAPTAKNKGFSHFAHRGRNGFNRKDGVKKHTENRMGNYMETRMGNDGRKLAEMRGENRGRKPARIYTEDRRGNLEENSVGDRVEKNRLNFAADRDTSPLVITVKELAAMTDEEVLKLLPRLRVVARALPTDKSRLVRLAQSRGLVTGMTGDGINDAPALKKADVGFAMGTGTEVAKEAGDIVILDNNFASIAKAIRYGRTIFKSIRKFVVFQLTMNLCAVGVSLIAPFIGIDTPVTVIQMLWINIIMDTLAGLAFAGEPPLKEYMEERPTRRNEPVLSRHMIRQIVFTGVYTVGLCLVFLKAPFFREFFRYEENKLPFYTAFFALFVFSGVFNAFNARTERINLLSHLKNNKTFVVFILIVIAVQLLLVYFGGTLFRCCGLSPKELALTLALAATVIPVDFIRKVLYKKAVKSRERILGKRLTKGKKYSIIKKNLGEERI